MSDYPLGDFYLAQQVMEYRVRGAHREAEAYRLQGRAKA